MFFFILWKFFFLGNKNNYFSQLVNNNNQKTTTNSFLLSSFKCTLPPSILLSYSHLLIIAVFVNLSSRYSYKHSFTFQLLIIFVLLIYVNNFTLFYYDDYSFIHRARELIDIKKNQNKKVLKIKVEFFPG